MKRFLDERGEPWVASVARDEGDDYKGRFYLALQDPRSPEGARVELADVRWNSRRTGERTVATMSDVELRRRLRSALGRAEGR